MVLLYHFWQYRAYFSVRYCLKNNRPKYLLIDMDNEDYIDLTDDEKLDVVAARIMKRFKPAFEELAK